MSASDAFASISSSTNGTQKDVAIFGLSGNPPTGNRGHAGIVHYLAQSGQFDQIWVLPVFQHQFSSKQSLAPFQTRVNLCQLAFESCSSDACTVRVLTLEEDVECLFKRHGTIDTLHYIKEHCPQAHLHLILGSDTYHDIAMGKWKQGADLFKVATLHIIERMDAQPPTSFQLDPTHQEAKQDVTIHEHRVSWLDDMSSSAIREVNPYPIWPIPLYNWPSVSSPFLTNPCNITPQVYQYIQKQKLYFFSESYLNAMKRCRIACLGLMCGGLLNYFVNKRSLR